MKQRILGILTVVLALSMVFSMVGCKDGGSSSTDTVNVSFNANGFGGAVPANQTKVKVGTKITLDPLQNFTKTDGTVQRFDGWATTGLGDGKYTAGTLVATTSAEEITTLKGKNETFYVAYTEIAPEPEDPDPVPEGQIRIRFNLNYTGAPDIAPILIEEGTSFTENSKTLPIPGARAGFVFGGWWNLAGTTEYTNATVIASSLTLYAKWTPDVLTADADAEVLYLTNGAHAVYAFDIPAGNTLADYEKVTVDFKISAAGMQAWNDNGIRAVRLYGVYTDATPVSHAKNSEPPYNQDPIDYFNLSGQDENGAGNENRLNNAYILDNGNTNDSVKAKAEADTWFTVEYEIDGSRKHTDFNSANTRLTSTGTIYYAVGLGCQKIENEADRAKTFIQLIKNVKLVPKDNAAEVLGTQPADGKAQFLSNQDPIVFEWRAPATDANIANWRTLVPQFLVESDFDRGPAPADADLTKVVISPGTTGDSIFTYINGGQVNNQRGWVSFGEAGRANSQVSTTASAVAFDNFINAWYLVLKTTAEPNGEVNLVWMGDEDGWVARKAISNNAVVEEGAEIIDNEDGTFLIKFLLPKALAQYERYFKDNAEWAGLGLSYWGSGATTNLAGTNVWQITEAYLLVATSEVVGSATGVSLGLSFTLGTAPAGGAIIDDVLLDNSNNLIVYAAAGLTDYRWYVNGVENGYTGGVFNVGTASPDDYVITLHAKKGGKLASQTVAITVE